MFPLRLLLISRMLDSQKLFFFLFKTISVMMESMPKTLIQGTAQVSLFYLRISSKNINLNMKY